MTCLLVIPASAEESTTVYPYVTEAQYEQAKAANENFANLSFGDMRYRAIWNNGGSVYCAIARGEIYFEPGTKQFGYNFSHQIVMTKGERFMLFKWDTVLGGWKTDKWGMANNIITESNTPTFYSSNHDVKNSDGTLFFQKTLTLEQATGEAVGNLMLDFGRTSAILLAAGLVILAALLGLYLARRFLPSWI